MSLYISPYQNSHTVPLIDLSLPVLLETRKGIIKHRIFSSYYKYSHIMMDSYEIMNRGLKELTHPIIPTGCMTLLFFLGHGARGELWGCNTIVQYVTIPANTCLYCIRLKPGAMRCFGENDMSALTDRKQLIDSLLRHCQTLYTQLRYAESFHERNVMIQRFLDVHHAGDFKETDKVITSLQAIWKRHGSIKINELAEQATCSSRYINRLFLSHIGIAPKMYCQIVQMYMSLHDILQNRPKSLLDTAVRWGYFDQAHMNRIYQKFLNKTAYEMKNLTSNDISQTELLLDTNFSERPPRPNWSMSR